MHDMTNYIATGIIIFIALGFDFLNGQHDASNAIASPIATGALSRRSALILSTICNFCAFLIFGLHVANTMGNGLTHPGVLGPATIAAALLGAIGWNIFTLKCAIPSSSSHALVGAMIGAAIAQSGWHSVHYTPLIIIMLAIIGSPLLGAILSIIISIIIQWTTQYFKPHRVNNMAKYGQIITCAFLSLAHGGNDAQKTMGIIAALLYTQHFIGPTFHVPFWVVIACQAAIALGTLAGGSGIVHTMGTKITRLRPIQGIAADGSSAISLGLATMLGIPVSSTHTITGSIVGAGMSRYTAAVRWNTIKTIVVAWFLTIPAAAIVGAMAYGIIHLITII